MAASWKDFGKLAHAIPVVICFVIFSFRVRKGCLSGGPQQWLRAQYRPRSPLVSTSLTDRLAPPSLLETLRTRLGSCAFSSGSFLVPEDVWLHPTCPIHSCSQPLTSRNVSVESSDNGGVVELIRNISRACR